MEGRFSGRHEEAAVRRAFEAVCAELSGYLPLRALLKRVRMACMWTRPSLDGRAEGAEYGSSGSATRCADGGAESTPRRRSG